MSNRLKWMQVDDGDNEIERELKLFNLVTYHAKSHYTYPKSF